MKIMAAGDLHGSEYYAKLLAEAFEREQPDKLVTLGDMVYQGVRNPMPREFSGLGTCEQLNRMAEKSIGARGNCDADVHQEFLHYPMKSDYVILVDGGRAIFATHGHLYNEHNLPQLAKGDILLQGHTHIPSWHRVQGIYIFNPGSPACPKLDTQRGYLIIEDGKVCTWKTMEGEVYHEEILE